MDERQDGKVGLGAGARSDVKRERKRERAISTSLQPVQAILGKGSIEKRGTEEREACAAACL